MLPEGLSLREKDLFLQINAQAKAIKKQAFSKKQVEMLQKNLLYILKDFEKHNQKEEIKDFTNCYLAINNFLFALHIAYSNYLRENRTLVSVMFGNIAPKILEPHKIFSPS